MIRFDELLIAPPPWMLLRAVRQAEVAVGAEPERLVGSSHNLARQGIQIRIDDEGELTWSNFQDTSTSASVFREVRLAWWSDYLGNRHIRVQGIVHEGAYARHWSNPQVGLPPLLRIYPDAGFAVSGPGIEPSLLVVCPCGATGTPQEIAWMGNECGPCHDRREADELSTRPWDGQPRHFRLEHTEDRSTGVRGFLPNGKLLLEDSRGLVAWDIATGRVAVGTGRDLGGIHDLMQPQPAEYVIPNDQVHELLDGKYLVVGYEGRLRVHESFTRIMLFERLVPKHFGWQTRTLVEGMGTVLLAVDGTQHHLILLSLPDLENLVVLRPGVHPFGILQTRNEHWLALRSNSRVQVVPWPPLVEWFTRYRHQHRNKNSSTTDPLHQSGEGA